MDNNKKVLIGLGIGVIGGYILYKTLTDPCPTSTDLGLGEQVGRLVCLSTEPKQLILSSVGLIMLWGGLSKAIHEL